METSVQHPATSARSGHPIVRPLLSVTRSTRQLFGLLLADIDVVVGQDQFLLQFTDDNPKKVSEIAAALSVRPSTISKMVDVLEAKHWVTRDRDGTDLRKVLVRLTPEGVKVRTKVSTIWDDIEAQISKALTGVDESFYANLNQLDDVLARRLSRLR